MKIRKRKVSKRLIVAAAAGFLLGITWFVGYRYLTYVSDNVHYHANFALYIQGQRDIFDDATFYEEVAACASDDENNPKARVHMHNQDNDLIHIHAKAVTWGQFFANLGYGLTDNLVKNDDGVYVDKQDGNRLSFILNGQPVGSVANKVIQNEDVLLINYGIDADSTLTERYNAIPKDAHDFNNTYDPGGCSGGEELTPLARLKKALGIDS